MHREEPESIMSRRCWAEIDLDALRSNAALAKDLVAPGGQIMGVVKADAYGHGLEDASRALADCVDFLGVANVAEALRIRLAGIERPRVFVLGTALEWERPVILEHDFIPAISSIAEAEAYDCLAAAAEKRLKVHLALDTGMGRIGFLDPDEILAHWKHWQNLEIEGVATHLPSADEKPEATRGQLEDFADIVRQLRDKGLSFRHVHAANSAGLLAYEHDPCTLFRPGLMLYGVSPLPDFEDRVRPTLQWKTRVTLVRDFPPGHGISYGGDFTTVREPTTRVATLAVGYGDGYPRQLSGRGADVLIGGRRCPVLGRVTMDQIMVDVSDLGATVKAGDEAILLGGEISAGELARKAGTIPWHILTGITRRVSRIVV
jgi:alanine racemase